MRETETSDKDRRIFERIREAERLDKRKIPTTKKRKWRKTKCPNCGYKVEYEPTETFQGRLRCPNCGEYFKVSRIDDYLTT